MNRRNALLAAAVVLCGGFAAPGHAQSYPSRSIRIIVPFAAAGPTDALARKVAELTGRDIGQQVVIENKAGAGGAIGTAEIARSAPDGYTLGMAGPDALISTATLVKNPGYDARTDLTMIMNISAGYQILVASSKSGLKSLDELFAQAKAKPNSVSFVSWGPGSRPELQFKMLGPVIGGSFLAVPYKGLGAAVQDVVANNVQLAVIPMGMATQMQQKGWLTPLAVLGSERAPDLPQLRTIREHGINLPVMDYKLWTALFGPKGLPPDILQRWIGVMNRITRSEAFAQFLKEGIGQTLIGHTTEQFTREFAEEFAVITDATRKLGIAPE